MQFSPIFITRVVLYGAAILLLVAHSATREIGGTAKRGQQKKTCAAIIAAQAKQIAALEAKVVEVDTLRTQVAAFTCHRMAQAAEILKLQAQVVALKKSVETHVSYISITFTTVIPQHCPEYCYPYVSARSVAWSNRWPELCDARKEWSRRDHLATCPEIYRAQRLQNALVAYMLARCSMYFPGFTADCRQWNWHEYFSHQGIVERLWWATP